MSKGFYERKRMAYQIDCHIHAPAGKVRTNNEMILVLRSTDCHAQPGS